MIQNQTLVTYQEGQGGFIKITGSEIWLKPTEQIIFVLLLKQEAIDILNYHCSFFEGEEMFLLIYAVYK
jgi:hypothetical protein